MLSPILVMIKLNKMNCSSYIEGGWSDHLETRRDKRRLGTEQDSAAQLIVLVNSALLQWQDIVKWRVEIYSVYYTESDPIIKYKVKSSKS